jgi:hypothetical protein
LDSDDLLRRKYHELRKNEKNKNGINNGCDFLKSTLSARTLENFVGGLHHHFVLDRLNFEVVVANGIHFWKTHLL